MPQSVRTGRPQPTYQQGFARSASESAYPSLWKGLVGAWAMGLGPTGIATLRDVSGNQNHGTIKGSMTSTDSVVSDGRYALDFDGTDDGIDLPHVPDLTIPFTIRISAD